MRSGSWIPSGKSKSSIITQSLLAAVAIQVVPVLLKWYLDDSFSIDGYGWSVLLSLGFLQMAVTTIPGRIGSFLGTTALVLGFFVSLLNVMNIGIFKSPISVITLSTTIQSNVHETMEFLHTYGSSLALTAGAYLTLAFILTALHHRAPRPHTLRPALILFLMSIVCTFPILQRSNGKVKQIALAIHELSYVNRLATTFIRYQGIMQAREQAKTFWRQRTEAPASWQLVHENESLPPIVVIVIGESTTRRHMGIYGYHRPTTPVLESMQDQLILFQNATAPIASTLPGVIGALCSHGFDPESLACKGPTLIEIAQSAGYKTSWISNQAPSGFGDNFIVELGRTTGSTHFVNQDVSSAGEADNSASLDEKVLGPLDQVIESSIKTGEKQMVFVHLMGTHFIYEKRYPKAERRFTTADDIRLPGFIKDPKAPSLINHYDNAVAYQDRLLGSIMERLNATGQDAVFVYFSDHGEEVYNSDNFAGHSEDRVTPAMREVPLIMGYSQSFVEKYPGVIEEMRQKATRPLTTFQLTPSVTGLLGIRVRAISAKQNGPPFLQK